MEDEAIQELKLYFGMRNNTISRVRKYSPKHPWRKEVRKLIKIIRMIRDNDPVIEWFVYQGKEEERSEHICDTAGW